MPQALMREGACRKSGCDVGVRASTHRNVKPRVHHQLSEPPPTEPWGVRRAEAGVWAQTTTAECAAHLCILRRLIHCCLAAVHQAAPQAEALLREGLLQNGTHLSCGGWCW